MNRFNSVMLILILGLSMFDGVMYVSHQLTPQTVAKDAVDSISLSIDVKAYHSDGTLYAERNLPNDLINNNLNTLLLQMFTPTETCVTNYVSTSNTALNLETYNTGYSSSYCRAITNPGGGQTAYCNTAPYCGTIEAIGTGTNTPTRSNYQLQTIYGSYFADTSSCVTGTTDTVQITGSDSITSSVSITEAGLFINLVYDPYNNPPGPQIMMLSHDTFTAINAVNGDTVTVTYDLSLNNSGFTTQFCNWLADILQGSIQSTYTNSVTLTDTKGNIATYYVWCSSPSNVDQSVIIQSSCGTSVLTNTNAFILMEIGTGTVSFTPSSTHLTNPIGSPTPISNTVYSSTNGQLYYTTTFTGISSSNTVTEAGVFLSLNSAPNLYLMFALTFSGQSQTANTPFGLSLEFTD
jgi:hypothetical protein